MIRVAAVADVHFGADSAGRLRPDLDRLPERADLLLIGGDLTRRGQPDEAAVLARELKDVKVPVLAVLGNHDYHSCQEAEVRKAMEGAGVRVLEGEAEVLEVAGVRIGVAGVKGFCGGFTGAATEFGEPEMKAFAAAARSAGESLERLLREMEADLKIALMHYAPIEATLVGERYEVWPFLGSDRLAEAVDRGGADLVLHGHAHAGSERGVTAGGVPVRNVAMSLIKSSYGLFTLEAPVRAR